MGVNFVENLTFLTYHLKSYSLLQFQLYGDAPVPVKEMPLVEVRLEEAVPAAFEMVLHYIYTDKIDPTKKGNTVL